MVCAHRSLFADALNPTPPVFVFCGVWLMVCCGPAACPCSRSGVFLIASSSEGLLLFTSAFTSCRRA